MKKFIFSLTAALLVSGVASASSYVVSPLQGLYLSNDAVPVRLAINAFGEVTESHLLTQNPATGAITPMRFIGPIVRGRIAGSYQAMLASSKRFAFGAVFKDCTYQFAATVTSEGDALTLTLHPPRSVYLDSVGNCRRTADTRDVPLYYTRAEGPLPATVETAKQPLAAFFERLQGTWVGETEKSKTLVVEHFEPLGDGKWRLSGFVEGQGASGTLYATYAVGAGTLSVDNQAVRVIYASANELELIRVQPGSEGRPEMKAVSRWQLDPSGTLKTQSDWIYRGNELVVHQIIHSKKR